MKSAKDMANAIIQSCMGFDLQQPSEQEKRQQELKNIEGLIESMTILQIGAIFYPIMFYDTTVKELQRNGYRIETEYYTSNGVPVCLISPFET